MDILEKVLKTIALILGIVIIVSIPAMYLWNWLMPYIFGLPTLNFGQTAGLLLLIYIFFYN